MIFNRQANTLLISKTHEGKATIINDILQLITKFSVNHDEFKLFLSFSQSLIPIKEFRTYIYKTKMLETIEDKFLEIWNKRREFCPQNQIVLSIINFQAPLSFHEDSLHKITTQNDLIESYVTLLEKTFEKNLRKNILNLLVNLAYCKQNKQTFLSKDMVLKFMINNILWNYKSTYHEKSLASQFLVNLLHKFNAAIANISKDQFIEELKIVLDECERKIDIHNRALQQDFYENGYSNNDMKSMLDDLGDNISFEERSRDKLKNLGEDDIEYIKILVNNLRKIKSVVSYS